MALTQGSVLSPAHPNIHHLHVSPRGLLFYSPTDYLRRALWALVQPLWRCSPRWFWVWRNSLLRCFGARIGSGVRIYPACKIQQPWNLSIGSGCTLAWDVRIYCLGRIQIGSDVVISQGAHLCAGDHAIREPGFAVRKEPITIDDGAWIAADAFIGPRVHIGKGAVVGARAVVVRDVPADSVVGGNPARLIGQRFGHP